MRLRSEQLRLLGGLALMMGIGLAVGSTAYSQVRFPLTNYRSTITVESPVAYYEHELRAGDTLFFHVEVTGTPVDMEVRKESAGEPDAVVLATTVDRWAIVPFPVSTTATYSVLFRAACAACGPTLVRAQVDQALGSIGIFPYWVTVGIGTALAAVGGWVEAARRKGRGAS